VTLANGSASGIARTLECAAWTSLPHVESSSEDADAGNRKHRFIAAVLAGTPLDAALAAVDDDDDRETCRALDWRALLGDLDAIESEAAFAVDFRARTARRLGRNLGRGYEAAAKALGRKLGAYEIPGAADVLGRLKRDGTWAVKDAKSGYLDVTPAAENAQLLFFASALYLLEGAEAVEVSIAKVKPDGSIWYGREGRAVVTPFELDAYMDRVEAAIVRGKEARALVRKRRMPVVNAGPWCSFCEAAPACPAKTQLARSFIGALGAIEARFAAMTKEERGRAFEIIKYQAKPLVERVEAALREMIIADGAVPLPSGKLAKPITCETSRMNLGAVLELARGLGASEEQIEGCRTTRDVTTIREVNGPRLRKGRAA
jgi:PD-(D/E)XK nuclease superfamily